MSVGDRRHSVMWVATLPDALLLLFDAVVSVLATLLLGDDELVAPAAEVVLLEVVLVPELLLPLAKPLLLLPVALSVLVLEDDGEEEADGEDEAVLLPVSLVPELFEANPVELDESFALVVLVELDDGELDEPLERLPVLLLSLLAMLLPLCDDDVLGELEALIEPLVSDELDEGEGDELLEGEDDDAIVSAEDDDGVVLELVLPLCEPELLREPLWLDWLLWLPLP